MKRKIIFNMAPSNTTSPGGGQNLPNTCDISVKKSGKWDTFLEDLFNKFSEYEVQKDRKRYNVANLEDWDQPGKPQGIYVTPKTFDRFLYKIRSYNVSEYENIKKMSNVTDLQIEELNQVLELTLKHQLNVTCSKPHVIVKASFISLNEAIESIKSNSSEVKSCRNFTTEFAAGKYDLFKFFALNKVFFDTDLSFSGKGTSVAVISPNWEVVGSRKIDISGADGKPPSKPNAEKGKEFAYNGTDGVPGNPGVSGKMFFGIGTTFTSGKNLTIISNGGKGGVGQNGGVGGIGESGKDAPKPEFDDPECENDKFADFTCISEEPLDYNVGLVYHSSRADMLIKGKIGGKGGRGGDGGKGGNGGDTGKIEVLELSRPSEIAKISNKGKQGEGGKAGAGGQGGKNGDDLKAEYVTQDWYAEFRDERKWVVDDYIKSRDNGPTGKKGNDGRNAVGLKDPVPAKRISRLLSLINEYQTYQRENANNPFNKCFSHQFLELFHKSKLVNNIYNIRDLIDEFQGLEEQYRTLSDQEGLSFIYSLLLERIMDFAEGSKNVPNSNENRKVLNYLYTATLGRLSNLREKSEQILIIDIHGYLESVEENIDKFKDKEMKKHRVDVVSKYKENYRKSFDNKIKEARSLIERQINPEIENISTEIKHLVNSLIEETIALQKEAEKGLQKLEQKKKDLQVALIMQGVCSFFHILAAVLMFLGPYGKIAGIVIETTTTVAETLILNEKKTDQKDFNLEGDVVSNITDVTDQIKEMRNQKVSSLNKLLDNVLKEINKNPKKLSDMREKIDEIKEKLKKASEKKMDLKQVKALEHELKKELNRKEKDLKFLSGDKKQDDALKVIKNLKQTAEFGSLLIEQYEKLAEDKEKINVVTDAMEKIKDKIKELKEYEENIHEIIEPMLQEMEDHMKEIRDKLGTKSQVSLDVTKWQVQKTLKDMQLQMEKITKNFKVKEDFSHSIEQLFEVMATLITIYDRIQSYQDQKKLSDYIGDISSIAENEIDIKDKELLNAVNRLDYVIAANVVLEQYKSALDALKQWVFPFADHYIKKSMLPSKIEQETNIKDLVQNAASQVEAIKRQIIEYDNSIKEGDELLHCAEFSSRYVSTKPFYVWKNKEHRICISRLLSGKEVVLKADIKKSDLDKDAIKFTEIAFDFKTESKTSQAALSEILKGFKINAIHLGYSYYRYNNTISLITSDSVTIEYFYEKDDAGKPVDSNEVYESLRDGDFLLSPYTLWQVKIINITNKYSFNDLKRYENEIYLELSGLGTYHQNNALGKNGLSSDGAESEKTGIISQCRPKHRGKRSPKEILQEGDYMSNCAPQRTSSPIKFLITFLNTYFIKNVIASLNIIFPGEKISERNHSDFSELLYEVTETKNIGQTISSNPSIENKGGDINDEGIDPKSDPIFNLSFDRGNSCSKSFLLSDQRGKSYNHSTQVPDLNCSLLLADLVTRTVTGNRYKSPINECLRSPPEVIFRKISNGVARNERDFKELLQRHLSEEEEEEIQNSVVSKIKGFAESMFQFFGLVGSQNTEKYV